MVRPSHRAYHACTARTVLIDYSLGRPGRIERAIRKLFDAHPDLAFVTDELVEHCYPGIGAIERKHQVAVIRAGQKVIAGDPDWTAWRAESQGGTWVFLNRANLQSYALATMMDGYEYYHSEQRAKRAGWGRPGDREDLLARLRPGSVNDTFLDLCAPNGAWARHVAQHCAKRDGTTEIAADLQAQRQAELGATARCFVAEGGDGKETLNPDPPESDAGQGVLAAIADRIRALATQNDPDAVRAGLAEIAAELDAWRAGTIHRSA